MPCNAVGGTRTTAFYFVIARGVRDDLVVFSFALLCYEFLTPILHSLGVFVALGKKKKSNSVIGCNNT